MNMAQRIKYPNAKPICIVEIVAPQTLFHWTNDATYTSTWYASTSYRITGCREDGSALSEAASLSACNTTNASYYWDAAAGRVYVNPTAADPRAAAVTIQALAKFHFSTRKKEFNDIPYPARMLGAPKSSRRIPAVPGDAGQIAGSKLTLTNAGFLDDKTDLDWGAAVATLKFGLDLW